MLLPNIAKPNSEGKGASKFRITIKSWTGLRELEAAFTGKRVDLHADNDHSASFKHMGRPTSGRCISRLLVRAFGLRIALALAWNTTEGQKHLFHWIGWIVLDSAVILGVIIYG